MVSVKVKCSDCNNLKGYRCEKTMKYVHPDKQRYCRKFQAKTQTTLGP